MGSHTYIHMHACASTIHDGQDMQSIQAPIYGLLTGKWWYIYTMDYYLTIKNNGIHSSVATWMERDNLC